MHVQRRTSRSFAHAMRREIRWIAQGGAGGRGWGWGRGDGRVVAHTWGAIGDVFFFFSFFQKKKSFFFERKRKNPMLVVDAASRRCSALHSHTQPSLLLGRVRLAEAFEPLLYTEVLCASSFCACGRFARWGCSFVVVFLKKQTFSFS